MPETILLVDYENVKDAGLKQLPAHDRVQLFVGKGQIPKPDFIRGMLDRDARLDLIQIAEQGRNNLDFYIAFYLGKIMQEEPNANCIVFSNDKDLDHLIAHLNKRGISCARMGPSPASRPVKAAPAARTPPQKPAAPKPLEKKASPKPDEGLAEAVRFLKNAGKRQPKAKEALINSLMSHLQKKRPEVEKIVEALIQRNTIAISKTNRVTYP